MAVKHTLVLALALATAAFAGLPQATLMPPPVAPQHFPSTQPVPTRRGQSAPWLALEQLATAERANAEIHIEPGTAGADASVREVERLWNTGSYGTAIEQLRALAGSFDLRYAFVGINWRKPVPTAMTDDWGANVRVGNRDSAYCTAFDRNAVNGNLLVGLLRHAGAQTNINVNLSTDGGTTWAETFDGNWSSGTPPSDLEGVCTGTAFFVAYPYPDINQVACLKFDAANGQWIQFPSGAWADTVFSTAPAQVTEIAMCSAEEMWPGQRVYAFARTDGDSLLYAWADGTGQPWHRYPTNIDWCSGGMIDCGVNTGFSTGGNWLWASFMYKRTPDTLHPAFASMEDSTGTWHASWINNLPTTANPGVTSLAAWKDTALIAYTHQGAGRFYTQAIVTYNAGGGWFYTNVPDDLADREMPDVTGTNGDGFALAHREYGSGRAIMYTRSTYDALSWTPQDSVSDHQPNWIEHPRIRWVGPGTYGVAYVTWDTPNYNSVWFNRTDWTGIAEQKPVAPGAFALRAVPTPTGVRLALNNPASGPVLLQVFDAAGRSVYSTSTRLARGQQTLNVPIRTAGIYFVTAQSGSLVDKARFFVIH
jgi:hypothetical protein